MAKNSYPAECQHAIEQFSPLAVRLAGASGLTLDDIRQEIAAAWLAGLDPRAAVPAAVGVRSLRRLRGKKWEKEWKSEDLHVAARCAELADDLEPTEEMPRPKARRGSVVDGIVADAGGTIGRRAAQKRLKRQREAAELGQGDLFTGGEG